MKKIQVIILFILLMFNVRAQQISTSGGSVENEKFSAEWIIGGSLVDNSVFSVNEETSGIEIETPNNNVLAINPSITRDFLTITYNNELKSQINYRINNSMGISVTKGILNTNTPFILDVKNLAAGYYLIIFNAQNDKTFFVTKKFVKL